MNPYMLIDFGSTFTKVTGVDLETCELLGSAKAFTTISEGILLGLQKAIKELNDKTGVRKWTKQLACSSAAGGLKMVGVGLVADLTAKAAKEAALSAGAKVQKVYSMELTKEDIDEINQLRPDIILLTGGTDGGNKDVVLHNAKMLRGITFSAPLIYAGNRVVKDLALSILEEVGIDVIATENVMPNLTTLNTLPARALIQEVFLNRIIEAKGIKDAEKVIDNVLMPTPLAVMKCAELLSEGSGDTKGFGELLVVDIGGATTDIHSVCDGSPKLSNVVLKGIEEPYVKRSVEGDLGARYSLESAVSQVGEKKLALELGISDLKLKQLISQLIANPEYTSINNGTKQEYLDLFDHLIAKSVTCESVERHAGKLKEHYTPFGMGYEQFGKDLTSVTKIIGTGGPLIHSSNPLEILEEAKYNEVSPLVLKPKIMDYYIDENYIMAAMGILSEYDKKAAYEILLKNLKRI